LKKKRVMDRSDEELELMDEEEDMANMLSTAHNSNSPVRCLFPENKEKSSKACNWPECLFQSFRRRNVKWRIAAITYIKCARRNGCGRISFKRLS
jgi:hypothetical protein